VQEVFAGTILRVSQPLRLDCETDHPAEASVLAAFGCTSAPLNVFLSDPSHIAHFEANLQTIPVDFDRFLFRRDKETLGTPAAGALLIPRNTCACWHDFQRSCRGPE